MKFLWVKVGIFLMVFHYLVAHTFDIRGQLKK